MPVRHFFFPILFLGLIPHFSAARQQSSPPATTTAQRDPQAATLLQNAIRAMGSGVPQDSVATGNVTVVEGSSMSSGTIRVLTRGTEQTAEEIQLPEETRAEIFSYGLAKKTEGKDRVELSTALMLTARSACFPLQFLLAALGNADEVIDFIGAETIDDHAAYHVRLKNTFASQPKLQRLSEFTVTDVWLDAGNGLPLRISLTLREGSGSSPRISLDVYYANYQNISGFTYPLQIKKSLNGTPWMTITITNVSFNTGLSETSFQVQ